MVGPVMRATIRKIGRAPRRAFANRDSLAETYYHHRRDGGRDQSQRVCAIRKNGRSPIRIERSESSALDDYPIHGRREAARTAVGPQSARCSSGVRLIDTKVSSSDPRLCPISTRVEWGGQARLNILDRRSWE
jgi:hypothetical protein